MENINYTECGCTPVCHSVPKDGTPQFLTKSSDNKVTKNFSRSVKARVRPLERALNGYFRRYARSKVTDLRRKGLIRMFAGGSVAKFSVQKALTPEEEEEFIELIMRYGDLAKDEEAKKAAKEVDAEEDDIFPLIWPSSFYTAKRRLFAESLRKLDFKADQAIRDILSSSTQETIRPTATELTRRINGALTGPTGVFSSAEASRIANTEIPSFKNFGKYEVYKKAGVTRLRWTSIIDERTRPANERNPRANHITMNGRETPLGVPFDMDVSGAKMFYPGDPSGPPFEVINCRCTLIPLKIPPQ